MGASATGDLHIDITLRNDTGQWSTLRAVQGKPAPPNQSAQWNTNVVVPQEVSGFYILLSVESKKPRTYLNYAVEIGD